MAKAKKMSLIAGQVASTQTERGYILIFKCWGHMDFSKVLEWLRHSKSALIYSDQKELTIKCEILKGAVPVFEKVVGIHLGLK